MFSRCGTKFPVLRLFAHFGTLFYISFQIFVRFVYNNPPDLQKKEATAQSCAMALFNSFVTGCER